MTNEITEQTMSVLVGQTQDMTGQASNLVITNEQQNDGAARFSAELKAEIKRREKLLQPTKEALDASKAAYAGLVGRLIAPLKEVVGIVTGKIGVFVKNEQARRAELQRIEDMRVAALQQKENERIAKLQAKAAVAGKPVPDIVPKIIPQKIIADVNAAAGTAYVEYWSAKVVNLKELCAAVASGAVAENLLLPNLPALNAMARATRKEGKIAPGVEAIKTYGVSQRTVSL